MIIYFHRPSVNGEFPVNTTFRQSHVGSLRSFKNKKANFIRPETTVKATSLLCVSITTRYVQFAFAFSPAKWPTKTIGLLSAACVEWRNAAKPSADCGVKDWFTFLLLSAKTINLLPCEAKKLARRDRHHRQTVDTADSLWQLDKIS